jgi:hypothetical protein
VYKSATSAKLFRVRDLLLSSSSFKKNEMGGACGTYVRQERCIQGFGRETWRKRPLGRPRRNLEDNIKIDFKK